jgi:hypothetical protein
VYSHVHCARLGTGKQLPVHDDMRRVEVHTYWFVPLYSSSAPLHQLLILESSIQQLSLRYSNRKLIAKRLPAEKIITGVQPLMKNRGALKQSWSQKRTLSKFTLANGQFSGIQLQVLFFYMMREQMSTDGIVVLHGDVSLQHSIR